MEVWWKCFLMFYWGYNLKKLCVSVCVCACVCKAYEYISKLSVVLGLFSGKSEVGRLLAEVLLRMLL